MYQVDGKKSKLVELAFSMQKIRYIINKRVFIVTLAIIFLTINIELIYNENMWVIGEKTPELRFFLSSTSKGHIPQIIIKWFLSIYPMLLVGETLFIEKKSNTHYYLIMQSSFKKYLHTKLIINTFICTLVFAISLCINYIINLIMYNGFSYTEDLWIYPVLTGQQTNIEITSYASWQYNHPTITVLVVIFIFCFIVALLTLFCTLLIFLFEEKGYIYIVLFLTYYIFITTQKIGIYGIMQPFTEHSAKHDVIPFMIFSICYIMINVVMYILVRKKYENAI